uniref:Uncharacterized protein n=1 Tax=Anguilla anguilla TaxID=7936 RepID=A0A0E9UYH5_ANGAN
MTRRSQLRVFMLEHASYPGVPPAVVALSLSRSALNQAQRPKCGGSNRTSNL